MSVDLTTTYLGIELKNPLVVSACPLTANIDKLKRLADSGAAAAVLASLFEEQIEHEEAEIARLYDFQTESFAESLDYFPDMESYNIGPEHYLAHVKEAKAAVDIPIIASLNGHTPGGWTRYAKYLEDAGADALELNIYIVPVSAHRHPCEIIQQYVDLVESVREAISIPLAVKLGPYFTNIAFVARQLVEAGADGLVFFNRYLEPDINIETLQVEPRLLLSDRNELWLPLRWIGIVRDQTRASLAATSGVHITEDIVKALLVGADVTMMASVLLQRGPEFVRTLLGELEHWLTEKQYTSVEQMKGSMSRENCPNSHAMERANYTKALVSFSTTH